MEYTRAATENQRDPDPGDPDPGDPDPGDRDQGDRHVEEDRQLEEVVEEAIFWANRAKDFERYEIADRVFAVLLSFFENNDQKVRQTGIEAGLVVREDRRNSGKLSGGYRDLAWLAAGDRELCIPTQKLARKYACWFYAHAGRHAERGGQRETREGSKKEAKAVRREAERAADEIKMRGRITDPEHYLS
jgi:hypothetical protein